MDKKASDYLKEMIAHTEEAVKQTGKARKSLAKVVVNFIALKEGLKKDEN